MDKYLLDSFFQNTCQPEDRRRIISWMLDPVNDQVLKSWMQNHWDLFTVNEEFEEVNLEKIWTKLQISLKSEIDEHSGIDISGKSFLKRKILAFAVAASLTGFVVLYFLRPQTKENQIVEQFKSASVKIENTGYSDKEITLEDGSHVTLKPQAELRYPEHFLTDKREVYLNGEAFFQVAKNHIRPFFIYHRNVVTHVLGTSFNVKANDEKGEFEVRVKTGRVEVYESDRPAVVKNNGVVLTPNQKVIYYRDSRKFETSVSDLPLPLAADSVSKRKTENLVFNNSSLPDIISILQREYGIEILLENENLNGCLFTGDLKGESLFDLLDIVCKSLNAVYEIKGTKILIKGKGCI